MKNWQGILIQVGINALITFLAALKDQDTGTKVAVGAGLAAVSGLVAHKTSQSNPDGTPAQEPWIPGYDPNKPVKVTEKGTV